MIEEHIIKARRVKTPSFLVIYTAISSLKEPHVSVTAAKKVAPRAVVRNKLRRRGYAATGPLLAGLSPTSAILISCLNKDTKTKISEMTEELRGAFQKTGLYK